MVAEGYYAARGMQAISKSYDINIPLATCIYEMLWENKNVEETFKTIEKKLS